VIYPKYQIVNKYVPPADRKAETPSEGGGGRVLTKKVLTDMVQSLLDAVNVQIEDIENHISKLAVENEGRHEDINKAISEGWENSVVIPFSLYAKLSGSESAAHKYIREVLLDLNRGVQGDNTLDILDMYLYLKNECTLFLEFINAREDIFTEQLIPLIQYASDLWGAFNNTFIFIADGKVPIDINLFLSDAPTMADKSKKLYATLLKTNTGLANSKKLLEVHHFRLG
jgi:hypothetical protein